MIAIIDKNTREVYFVADGIRKMSFEEASVVLQSREDEVISIVPVQHVAARDMVAMLAGISMPIVTPSVPVNHQQSSLTVGRYIVPARASAVIVSGLNPTLMFENGYDYKLVDSIKSTYGGTLPHQVDRLIISGRLRLIDDAAIVELERKKQENIKVAQRKHKNGGRKIGSLSDGDDMSDDEDDRIVRKATRINL
jgi:hypothetical protein